MKRELEYQSHDIVPLVLQRAVRRIDGKYSAGKSDISVTGLIGPTGQFVMRKTVNLPEPEGAQYAKDRLYALMGSAMHYILEQGGEGSDAIIEERYFADIDGWIVSGQVDFIENGWLCDWKMTSVWEVINGPSESRHLQLNCNAHLAILNGVDVQRLAVCYILRDWSKAKARFDKSYPQSQFQFIEVPLWSQSEREDYMVERVNLHRDALDAGKGYCSPEEQWRDPDKWAVRKGSNKRAVKLYDNEQDADAHAAKEDILWVEHRVSEARKCLDYCDYRDVCPQYQEEIK